MVKYNKAGVELGIDGKNPVSPNNPPEGSQPWGDTPLDELYDVTDAEPAASEDEEPDTGDSDPADPDGGDNPPADEKPSGGASTEEWREYALAHGKTEEDLTDSNGKPLGRNAIRDLFTD